MERPAFSFADSLAGNPIIAAVKEPEGLDRALDSDCGVIFLLCGDICTIGPLAARVSGRGKALFIHADLVDGLAGREVAVDFIRENTGAAGIISTKPSLIRRAREVGPSSGFSSSIPWPCTTSAGCWPRSSGSSVPTWWRSCLAPCPKCSASSPPSARSR